MRIPLDAYQFGETLHNLGTDLHLRQVVFGVLHLRLEPARVAGLLRILQPAIRVRDGLATNGLRTGLACVGGGGGSVTPFPP